MALLVVSHFRKLKLQVRIRPTRAVVNACLMLRIKQICWSPCGLVPSPIVSEWLPHMIPRLLHLLHSEHSSQKEGELLEQMFVTGILSTQRNASPHVGEQGNDLLLCNYLWQDQSEKHCTEWGERSHQELVRER